MGEATNSYTISECFNRIGCCLWGNDEPLQQVLNILADFLSNTDFSPVILRNRIASSFPWEGERNDMIEYGVLIPSMRTTAEAPNGNNVRRSNDQPLSLRWFGCINASFTIRSRVVVPHHTWRKKRRSGIVSSHGCYYRSRMWALDVLHELVNNI